MSEIEKTVFSNQWMSIKQTPRGFYYLERKGKDSIAVFLLRWGKVVAGHAQREVLVRQQPLPVHNADIDEEMRLYPCPITGIIDPGESAEQAAIREAFEEAGYKLDSINSLGQYIVGTQTNETVFLFFADVTDIKPSDATGDGTYFESISKNEWHPLDYLRRCDYAACQVGYLKLKTL